MPTSPEAPYLFPQSIRNKGVTLRVYAKVLRLHRLFAKSLNESTYLSVMRSHAFVFALYFYF